MIDANSLEDLTLLRESIDLEFKLAAGQDGGGALPHDFWPTYSAFANTEGGVVVLGVKEKGSRFEIVGLKDADKVRRELFDLLSNRNKVSCNLLSDKTVQELSLDGKTVIVVEIPRATRRDRPVFVTQNPFGNTYRRANEGDRKIPDQEVKRMLAEQVEDSRDSRILPQFGIADLHLTSLVEYRQSFAVRDPGHPWNALTDHEFLRQIGGWKLDRETNTSGLTVAGLLMFGSQASIFDEFPTYMLDYQERTDPSSVRRWVDRLTLDGKWSGNLFDFYRKVYLKLTADLKVPFVLEKGQRQDQTPVHEALREALANVLVHADYSDKASVLVVKRPDMFGFRNPGLMRIPPAIAIQGGEHDCRNQSLHRMFRLVGVGEAAGSGIPKIFTGWASQHWRAPALYEKHEPYAQTLLELRMVDLLPEEIIGKLRRMFGKSFDSLDQNGRLALAAALTDQVVSHARLREMTALHPVDLTKLLQGLVKEGFLEQHNPGRGAVYCLQGADLPTPEEVFGGSSEHLGFTFLHLADFSAHQDQPHEERRDAEGRLLSEQLDAPVIDSLEALSPPFLARMKALATDARQRRKLSPDVMKIIVLDLCRGHYLTLNCIAQLVNRDPDAFRQQYLKPLTRDGRLTPAFPTAPTHRRQAYKTA